MSASTTTQSVYDRERHVQNLKDWFGEDLWLTKSGKPRKVFCDSRMCATLLDGTRQRAKQAFNAFTLYLPWSVRNMRHRWNNYGTIAPPLYCIQTVTRTNGYGLQPPIWTPKIWLNHLFLRRSVLPAYGSEDQLDSLMMDVDVEIDGESPDLFVLTDSDRIRILRPWVEAMDHLGAAVGSPITADWMLSGSRGFWLQVHFEDAGSRADALRLRDAIVNRVPGDLRVERSKPIVQFGDSTYNVDLGNLGNTVCRLPWSLHQRTDNVSVHIDPLTGQPEPLRFVHATWNSMTLEDCAACLPRGASEHPLTVSVPCDTDELDPFLDDSTNEVLDQEEVQAIAQRLFAALDRQEARQAGAKEVEAEDQSSPLLSADSSPGLRVQTFQRPTAPTPASPRRGGGRVLEWGESMGSPRAPFKTWTYRDVIREAKGDGSITPWHQLVLRDAPDGHKFDLLVLRGNIVLVAAAMKGQLGRVDWDQLTAEYEQAYADADWSKGGTLQEWIERIRKWTDDGRTLRPPRIGLTPEMVARCEAHAQRTIASLPYKKKPSADSLYHLLLVLCRLCVVKDEFEAALDYLSRRAALNPYPTWEEQRVAEGRSVPDVADEDGVSRPVHARHYPTSERARKRLVRLLHLVCDMDGVQTGLRPFVRLSGGVNDKTDERVVKAGRAVGSLFRKVAAHPFWTEGKTSPP